MVGWEKGLEKQTIILGDWTERQALTDGTDDAVLSLLISRVGR